MSLLAALLPDSAGPRRRRPTQISYPLVNIFMLIGTPGKPTEPEIPVNYFLV